MVSFTESVELSYSLDLSYGDRACHCLDVLLNVLTIRRTVNTLTERIQTLDGLVWQPFAMPLVLVIVGGLITFTTGFVQIRRFPLAVRFVLISILKRTPAREGSITPFQALSTALASTVGNGNIGGVATAILIGGPGAIA